MYDILITMHIVCSLFSIRRNKFTTVKKCVKDISGSLVDIITVYSFPHTFFLLARVTQKLFLATTAAAIH